MDISQIIDKIHNDIEKNSYAKVDNFLNVNIFEDIKEFLKKQSSRLNKNNFSVDNTNKLHPLENILANENFKQIYSGLLKKAGIINCNETYYVMGLREGKNIKKTVLYHFDAYYLTILFPILIPKNENNGKLHIFPRWRKIQKYEIFNFFQKFFIQNPITRKIINLRVVKKILRMKEINLDPNFIYFFEGYRSIHGVGKHSKKLRSTAVFHFHNPHKNKFFNEFIKNKHIKERNKIKKL